MTSLVDRIISTARHTPYFHVPVAWIDETTGPDWHEIASTIWAQYSIEDDGPMEAYRVDIGAVPYLDLWAPGEFRVFIPAAAVPEWIDAWDREQQIDILRAGDPGPLQASILERTNRPA